MRVDFTSSIHIFTLSSFAIAQPLFDLLSRNAAFFVVRRSEPLDILILCALVCVVLPLCLILLRKGLGWIHPKMGWWTHTSMIGGFVAILMLQGLRQILVLPGTVLILGATGIATLVVWSYMRSLSVRLFFSLLSPGLLIFPGLFLLSSPVSKLVFPNEVIGAKPQQMAESATPVVVVIFDELPVYALLDDQRQIDATRFPHIASFAKEATWFRNATTVSPSTMLAVPAILTGNYPDAVRIPTAAEHPHNLFTLLGGSHNLKVFESQTQLCPEHLCQNSVFQKTPFWNRLHVLVVDVSVVLLHLVLPQDWRDRLPVITQGWMNFVMDFQHSPVDVALTAWNRWTQDLLPNSSQTYPQRFVDFIETLQGGERPTLYFTHVLLPHRPYIWLPSGKQYGQRDLPGLPNTHWLDDELATDLGYQRFQRQVGLVDTLIGKLVSRLQTEGLYDRSLIVLTADHGMSFRPNQPSRLLTEENAPDILRVPLFIKAPYQRVGVMSDRNVETVDIVPTIADLLEVSLPWTVDGQSAFDSVRPEKEEKIAFSGSTAAYHDRYVFEGAFPPTQKRNDRLSLAFGLEEGQADRRRGLLYYPDLVGQQVNSFLVKEDSDVAILIDRSDLFSQIDLSDDFVPAYITGAIRLNETKQLPPLIALALNGRIQSFTRPWGFPFQGRRGLWATLVDESAFRTGQNNVEAFVVSLDGEWLSRTRDRKF